MRYTDFRRACVALAATMIVFAAGSAYAACVQPQITALSEANGPNCGAATCGFIIVHWSGRSGCDHYNIRERSGTQFEAPGTDRNQLDNRRSKQFPSKFGTNQTIFVSIQGCTTNFVGKSSCTPWSSPVSFHINDSMSSPRGKFCQEYARRAVGTVKYAQDRKCDPKVISGPRWTTNAEEHRSWCMTASAAAINAENRARSVTAQQCRIEAGMPKGNAKLQVQQKGDSFILSGGGYAPNSRVIIRVTGPGGTKKNFTNQFANAKGVFTATLTGLQICDKPVGTVTFTAEDQDNKPSAPVTALCR